MLNSSQTKRIANILDNLGQVFLATVAIQNFFVNNVYSAIGLIVAYVAWFVSISLESRFHDIHTK